MELGAILSGNIDVAKAHGHHVDADDTSIENTDTKAESVDAGSTDETRLATIKEGVGVGHLDILNESQTSDVAEHSVETTHIGDIDASPTGTACPRIDKQLGGASGTTAFVIASLGRRDGEHREKHNYSKYS